MDTIRYKERRILRELASRVAELAGRPVEQEKRALWYRHNDLGPTRPLVFCDPENGWNEIIPPDRLECKGNLARLWEMFLRKEIFWGEEMLDDKVITRNFNIGYVSAPIDWGLSPTRIGGGNGGSYTWDPPIKSYDDLSRLRIPELSVDYEATDRVFELASETFDGLLNVRLRSKWWWSLGLTWPAVDLRGLGQLMYDMFDNPDGLHALMSFLSQGMLSYLDKLEAECLLGLNNEDDYVGSGGFGWSHELPQSDSNDNVRAMDLWGFCESQETSGVSPEFFEEFVFRYQLPILSRFGLNCYGCCEPLDTRWQVIEQTPRLRRVSVSAWANLEKMAEALSDRYILSLKPNPAVLAAPSFDEDAVRNYLREAMRIGRNCRMEVIMKDNHTICNDPSRVKRWVRIAREEADR